MPSPTWKPAASRATRMNGGCCISWRTCSTPPTEGFNHEGDEGSQRIRSFSYRGSFPGFPSCSFVSFVVNGFGLLPSKEVLAFCDPMPSNPIPQARTIYTPDPLAPGKLRLDSVDILRGIIMVVMALDHVRD